MRYTYAFFNLNLICDVKRATINKKSPGLAQIEELPKLKEVKPTYTHRVRHTTYQLFTIMGSVVLECPLESNMFISFSK